MSQKLCYVSTNIFSIMLFRFYFVSFLFLSFSLLFFFSLPHYLFQKNKIQQIYGTKGEEEGEQEQSRVLVASSVTFDPFSGDIFSSLCAGAILCLVPRSILLGSLLSPFSPLPKIHFLSLPFLPSPPLFIYFFSQPRSRNSSNKSNPPLHSPCCLLSS